MNLAAIHNTFVSNIFSAARKSTLSAVINRSTEDISAYAFLFAAKSRMNRNYIGSSPRLWGTHTLGRIAVESLLKPEPDVIISDCGACRMQISNFTDTRIMGPIRVMYEALGLGDQ